MPAAASTPQTQLQGQMQMQQQQQSARGGTAVAAGWRELDAKFRRDLPDAVYASRLAYRGLVMRACPAIRVLDGVEVSEKEKDKAEKLLRSVSDARKGSAQPPHHPQQQ